MQLATNKRTRKFNNIIHIQHPEDSFYTCLKYNATIRSINKCCSNWQKKDQMSCDICISVSVTWNDSNVVKRSFCYLYSNVFCVIHSTYKTLTLRKMYRCLKITFAKNNFMFLLLMVHFFFQNTVTEFILYDSVKIKISVNDLNICMTY